MTWSYIPNIDRGPYMGGSWNGTPNGWFIREIPYLDVDDLKFITDIPILVGKIIYSW